MKAKRFLSVFLTLSMLMSFVPAMQFGVSAATTDGSYKITGGALSSSAWSIKEEGVSELADGKWGISPSGSKKGINRTNEPGANSDTYDTNNYWATINGEPTYVKFEPYAISDADGKMIYVNFDYTYKGNGQTVTIYTDGDIEFSNSTSHTFAKPTEPADVWSATIPNNNYAIVPYKKMTVIIDNTGSTKKTYYLVDGALDKTIEHGDAVHNTMVLGAPNGPRVYFDNVVYGTLNPEINGSATIPAGNSLTYSVTEDYLTGSTLELASDIEGVRLSDGTLTVADTVAADTQITINALLGTNQIATKTVTVTAAKTLTPETLTAEDVVIDYTAETITLPASTGGYTINTTNVIEGKSSEITVDIDEAWFGNNISIIKKSSDTENYLDSDPLSVSVEARPAAPVRDTDFALVQPFSGEGNSTAKITAKKDGLEYSTDGNTWTPLTNGTKTDTQVSEGTLYVRAVATASTSHGSAYTVSVNTYTAPEGTPLITAYNNFEDLSMTTDTNWNFSNANTWYKSASATGRTTSESYSGERSLAISSGAISYKTAANSIKPYSKYTLTAKVKSASAQTLYVRKGSVRKPADSLSNTSYDFAKVTTKGTGEWESISTDFYTYDTTETQAFFFMSASGTVYLDDVYLNEIEDNSSEKNILLNGHFTSDLVSNGTNWTFKSSQAGNWYYISSNAVAIEDYAKASSGKALRTTATNSNSAVGQYIPLATGKTYTLTAHFAPKEESGTVQYFGFLSTGNNTFSGSGTALATGTVEPNVSVTEPTTKTIEFVNTAETNKIGAIVGLRANSGVYIYDVSVTARENAPSGFTVDYANEQITGLTANAEYTLTYNDGEDKTASLTADESGNLDISDYTAYTGLGLIVPSTNETLYGDSNPAEIANTVQTAPVVDTDYTVTQPTAYGEKGIVAAVNGALLEYSTDGATWTAIPDEIEQGTTFYLRKAATNNGFASEATGAITVSTIAQTYTITYHTNGGTAISADTKENNAVYELPAPVRDGYTFGGWYTDENLTTRATLSEDKYTVTANADLYAKWTVAAADIAVDYVNETLTGFVKDKGYTYKIDNTDVTSDISDGTLSVVSYIGKDNIAIDVTADNVEAKTTQTLAIGLRPAAPSVTTTQPSAIGGKGTISGLTTAMEYKVKDTDDAYTKSDGSDITDVGIGTVYLVRIAAVEGTSFKSLDALLVIMEK